MKTVIFTLLIEEYTKLKYDILKEELLALCKVDDYELSECITRALGINLYINIKLKTNDDRMISDIVKQINKFVQQTFYVTLIALK